MACIITSCCALIRSDSSCKYVRADAVAARPTRRLTLVSLFEMVLSFSELITCIITTATVIESPSHPITIRYAMSTRQTRLKTKQPPTTKHRVTIRSLRQENMLLQIPELKDASEFRRDIRCCVEVDSCGERGAKLLSRTRPRRPMCLLFTLPPDFQESPRRKDRSSRSKERAFSTGVGDESLVNADRS